MLYGVDLVTRTEVAAAALFVWDYIITLGMELPVIDTVILTLYRDLLPNQPGLYCRRLQLAQGFLYITGFATSEILLTFRVWAVWNRDRILSYVLPISFAVIWIPAYVVMYYFSESLEFLPLPPYKDATGCFVVHASNLVVWCWAALMAWNTLTLVLMVIQGIRSYRVGANSTLMTIIYRDGTVYYLYLFALSVLNIVFAVTVTPTKRFVLTTMERCLHTILASRVILHMRDHARVREVQFTEDASGDRVDFNVSALRDDIDVVLNKAARSTPRMIYKMRNFD
ncbi:hypothetical protein D9613_000881 [Agrocybe pediades]|uniref:Uncharacterized protein n=1 Tax=Agrocybe pediades TaxID=84607 RepID=A0A8H4R3E5_9AGAR|nr:hypothetical protein D9613_000881 [Agrocybe pediades]